MPITIQPPLAAAVLQWRLLITTIVCLIALTACTPVQPATPAPSTTPTAPTQVDVTGPPAGVLSLPGQWVTWLVMDEQFVYWVGLPDERFLYQAPLRTQGQPTVPEIVAESRYPAGVLSQLPFVQNGDWLTFLDSASAAISEQWALRRVNLVTGEENTLAESTADKLLYGFALSNRYAAWSMLDHASNRTCQDEAVLVLADLATGQQAELDRACFQTEHSWSTLALSGDTLIANLLDNTVEEAPWGRVARFDLAGSQPVTYTIISDRAGERQTNFRPQAIGDWVTWSRGEENFGEPVLLNLRTTQTETLSIAASTAPCQYLQVTERWFAGSDCAQPSRLLLYDPVQQQVVRLQTNGSEYGYVVASAGGRVAVARRVEPETAKPDSVIEWYELDSHQAASQAIANFVWQTDALYGYRMLRPAGWATTDLVTARGYFPDDTTPQTAPLLLTTVNLEALASIAAATKQEVVPFRLFQQTPELLPWTAAMEKQWQAAGLHYTFVEALSNGLLYAFDFPDAGFITLSAYVVNVDQPLLLQLTSREATTLEQLRDQGILADFATMVESVTAVAHKPDQGAPFLTEEGEPPAPITNASEPPPMVYVDQRVPGDLKLALLGYTQQSTTQPVKPVGTPMAHPIPANICRPFYEVTNSYNKSCAREIERYQFEQGTPTVARTAGQLTLTLPNGDVEVFTDQEGEGGGGWALYSYINYLPELNAYLLYVQYYEGNDYLLVQAADGRKLVLTTPPIIAPDGKHFFTTFNLFENPLQIFLWRIVDGWAVPQQSLRFEPVNRFAGAIESAAWLSASELAVTVAGLSNGSGGTIKVIIEPELTVTFNGAAVTRPAIDPWRVTYHNAYVRQVDTATVGKAIYADRDYVFTKLPSFLVDQPYFLFENSRMDSIATDYIHFQLYRPATLYVALDEQACALPGWLDGWSPVDGTVATTDIGLKLYAKSFDAGDLILGGNTMAPAACIRSHYLLFVVAE